MGENRDRDAAAELTTSGSAELDLVLKFALAERGRVAVEYLDHKRRQHRDRGAAFLDGAGVSGEEAIEAAMRDERLDEALNRAAEAAVATSDKGKVHLLGKVFRRCLDAGDDATVDAERIMLDTIASLDAPHMRMLVEWRRGQDPVRVPTAASRAGIPQPVAGALVAHLVRAGLLSDITEALQRQQDADDPGVGLGVMPAVPTTCVLTEFGKDVAHLLETERPPPS